MSYTQRTADYVIQKGYRAFKGKAVPPASTTTKYAALLGILDSAQDDWRYEPGIEWDSLYQTVVNGTITATDTFDLDDEIDFVSKRKGDYITLSSGTQSTPVLLVKPDQLYAYKDELAVARIGRELKFSKAFASDSPYIGYSLNIPAYIFTDDITSGSDLIRCDDPMYLAYMLAAEVARNDTVKAGQFNNLLDKAAERMERMKENNSGQEDTIARHSYAAAGEDWI